MVTAAPFDPSAPPHLSDDAWATLPEDESGELINGVLVEEEVPDWTHETAVGWLIAVFRAWGVPRGARVAASELKYVLGQGKGRKPDVSVLLSGSKPPPGRGAMRRPPDIMIEVVSPSPRDVRRDRLEKRAEYAAFGVRWFWLLEPATRMLEIYELGPDGRYVVVLGAAGGQIDTVPGCEGLVLALDELWAEIDALGEEEAEEPEG